MAIVLTDDKHYKAIADKLREIVDAEATYRPEDMADEIGVANNAGYEDGYADGEEVGYDNGYDLGWEMGSLDGYDSGYDEGRKAGYDEGAANGYEVGCKTGREEEYDRFWGNYQQNGKRRHYGQAFAGYGWTPKMLKPKYQFGKLTNISSMFQIFNRDTSNPDYVPNFDLTAYLEELGIEWDMSECNSCTHAFSESRIIRVPELNFINCTAIWVFGSNSDIKTIDKMVLREDGSNTFHTTFDNMFYLENLVIEGKIGQNGFDVSECTLLTHESLMSIINALYDYNGTATTRTITLGATNLAKLTDAEKAIATQKGWTLA